MPSPFPLGYLEGFHYRPRVDLELLTQYHEGLIAGSACLAGAIPRCLMQDDVDAANEILKKYLDIFGPDNFVIELMDHGLPEEKRINPMLIELANRHGLMIIATNDSHYTDKSDAKAHDALLCIQTNQLHRRRQPLPVPRRPGVLLRQSRRDESAVRPIVRRPSRTPWRWPRVATWNCPSATT